MIDYIEQILYHEAEAEKLQTQMNLIGEKRDQHRWEAARLIKAQLDDGMTQRELAKQIGKSQPHVSIMSTVHKIAGDNHGNRSFDSWYQEVKRGNKRSAPRGRPARDRNEKYTIFPAKFPAEKVRPEMASRIQAVEAEFAELVNEDVLTKGEVTYIMEILEELLEYVRENLDGG